MPRRSVLSSAERENLFKFPETEEELIRYYTLNDADLALIKQRRGNENKLGIAVQLCLLRFPGQGLLPGLGAPDTLVSSLRQQLQIDPLSWSKYAERDATRREHLLELRNYLGLEVFKLGHHRQCIKASTELAMQTDKGVVLAEYIIDYLRKGNVIVPAVDVIERVCAEAITRADRRIHGILSDSLDKRHQDHLDELLLRKPESKITWLAWLRQPPGKPNSRYMLEHIKRLEHWQSLGLTSGVERHVHQNRLLKIAREGAQMTPADLSRFEPKRRYATLVALAIESTATVTDEIIDLHDRIMGKFFNTAKNKHKKQFHSSGKAINNKVRLYARIGQALLDAKLNGYDPYTAIENIMPWKSFSDSVTEAQNLAQPETFDSLQLIGENYPTLRRYAPQLLNTLKLQAAPAAKGLLAAIETLRDLNDKNIRKLPLDAPKEFIKPRWSKLVFSEEGIDRRFYELCAMSELKNGLRSGDIWVQGSRQFRNFDEYLVPPENYIALKQAQTLPLNVATDCDQYLNQRIELLKQQLSTVNKLAATSGLPDAIVTESGLRITPLDAVVPGSAQNLIKQTSVLLPRIKITDLLVEVDSWTGFTQQFTHLKTGNQAKDKTLLLTAVLADGINLGLSKMSESCPGTTYSKLSWLQAWHIRDDTYNSALAQLVNVQLKQPLAKHWGDGTTSSSDGQRFKTGSKAESSGHINPKYGSSPGRTFYTHITDQYSPFSAKVINVGIRDATYVLDGLLYHEADLRIEEHYTDTAGFTDHVFGLMHLLGFRFAPRIRDLGGTKLFTPKLDITYDALKPLISGEKLNIKQIRTHWDEILRLATSIKQGTVTASLMLRKLGSYPRQNGLAIALRELGRIERTLFILDWLQNTDLRRRVHAGLNKGEARNALARAVFFYRLGELRDRSFEQQRYRASGLNLVTAAIVLWNTVYLDRSIAALKMNDPGVDDDLLQHLSPLGWEHINLTGDYHWPTNTELGEGEFRPLRALNP